jgi:hypothetical protein
VAKELLGDNVSYTGRGDKAGWSSFGLARMVGGGDGGETIKSRPVSGGEAHNVLSKSEERRGREWIEGIDANKLDASENIPLA